MDDMPLTSPCTMLRPRPLRLILPTAPRIEFPIREKIPGTWPTVLDTLERIEFT